MTLTIVSLVRRGLALGGYRRLRGEGGILSVAAGSQIELLPIKTGEDDVQKSVGAVAQYTAANADLAGCFCRWMAVFC